jgi:hypothetical protein
VGVDLLCGCVTWVMVDTGNSVDIPLKYSKKRENDYIRILCYFTTLLRTFSYVARVDSVSLCYRATGSCVSCGTPTHTITSNVTYRDPTVIHTVGDGGRTIERSSVRYTTFDSWVY